MREKVLPAEQELRDFYEKETWTIPAVHQQLQQEAKAAGLWNLFLPLETDPEAKYGAGLTNLEYAHLCEVRPFSVYDKDNYKYTHKTEIHKEMLEDPACAIQWQRTH